MATTPQKNSFVTLAEQITLMNKNSIEIMTKMNDIVTSDKSVINVEQIDEFGKKYTYLMPTVGKLQSEISIINNNINRLSGLNNNNAHIISGKSTKKIYLADLNREPNRINNINSVKTFSKNNNWFFESLMNPMLFITFNLTNKVGNDVDGVISRRYIVKFEKTENGDLAKLEFKNKFINNTNVRIEDFIKWHTNPTNTGVVNNLNPIYDEEKFDFEYQDVSNYGVFSVEKQELDSINNILWFHITPYKYYSITGEEKTLKIGDELILNKQDSISRWKIIEISKMTSNFKVRLEVIEGYDPIPTGTNVLKYYGDVIANKEVKVSIGFDEHLVVFMKPINSRNKIKGSVWSFGTGLYTNDLRLDVDNNVSMSTFYLNTVDDYGSLLKDLITKQIPSKAGIYPSSPSLDLSSFKVVQINKHLTNTDDINYINELYSNKVNLESKKEQRIKALTQLQSNLSDKKYGPNNKNDEDNDVAELTRLTNEQTLITEQLDSVVKQITNKLDTMNKIDPKFRIRGFWNIPEPKKQIGYRPQEIIQFDISYRYFSQSGTENQTEGITIITNDGKSVTGYWSNWVNIKTSIRQRYYDIETGDWSWVSANISDTEINNINQLDIPITQGEKVEIRIRSISEVGYPSPDFISDWSQSIIVDFPDDLKGIITKTEFIEEETKKAVISSEFESKLISKGIIKHTSDSFYNKNNYIAHRQESIITDYKNDNGEEINLKNYLDFLTKKIEKLESIINSAKGVLKIIFYNGVDEIVVNDGEIINTNVVLQDRAKVWEGSVYLNEVYKINKYYLKISNLSDVSPLRFLINEKYETETPNDIRMNIDNNLVSVTHRGIESDQLTRQTDGQWLYFCDTFNGKDLYMGSLENLTGTTTFQLIDTPEDYDDTLQYTAISAAAISKTKNLGLSKDYKIQVKSPVYKITGRLDYSSQYNEWYYGDGSMGTLIVPHITNTHVKSNFKEFFELKTSGDVKIPINIYGILSASPKKAKDPITDNDMNFFEPGVDLSELPLTEHVKSLRVVLSPSTYMGKFEFVLTFNIQNKRL